MKKVAKELEYNLKQSNIPPLKEPKNPCQQCQRMKFEQAYKNIPINDPRANPLSAIYNPKYDPRSLDYQSGVHNPLAGNYDPWRR